MHGIWVLGVSIVIGLLSVVVSPASADDLGPIRVNVERALPTLEVESDPSGALVQIGEERLGTTPLFMENNFPPSEIEVRVSLHGYQPWKGVFLGGETAVVKAKLKRR